MIINKSQPLFWQINTAEKLNKDLGEYVALLQLDLARVGKLVGNDDENGYSLRLSVPEKLEVDIPKIQKEIFERFRGNYHLERALKGETTLRGGLEELNWVNKGVRLYLPQFKNREHNKRVEEMEKLIGAEKSGDILGLKTHNPWYLNNISTAFMYGAAIGALAGYMGPVQRPPDHSGWWFGALMFGALSSIVGSFVTECRKELRTEYARADFLDKKIKILYQTQN